MVPYRAYLALKTVDNDVATWVPSVSDILAEDWYIEGSADSYHEYYVRLRDFFTQLTRYGGGPDAVLFDVLETITDINDDMNHSRPLDESITRAKKELDLILEGDRAAREEVAKTLSFE